MLGILRKKSKKQQPQAYSSLPSNGLHVAAVPLDNPSTCQRMAKFTLDNVLRDR